MDEWLSDHGNTVLLRQPYNAVIFQVAGYPFAFLAGIIRGIKSLYGKYPVEVLEKNGNLIFNKQDLSSAKRVPSKAAYSFFYKSEGFEMMTKK